MALLVEQPLFKNNVQNYHTPHHFFKLSSYLTISFLPTMNVSHMKLTLSIKIKSTTFWSVIMTAENVLTYASPVLVGLIIVVQINTMLPQIKHVLICLSELKQLLSHLTNGHSHIKKQQNFVDTTVRLTITRIHKAIIRTQWFTYHAVNGSDCQICVRHLLARSGPKHNRTI